MNITLQNTGKRYNREWIFRKFNYTFLQGNSYAITGANGSGKSTLLQIIAGATLHSEGTITRKPAAAANNYNEETSYQQIAIVAPYLDVVEEMTAIEFLQFHQNFKPLVATISDILNTVGLSKAGHKEIRYFSSGMKQRLKLAQAFFSDTTTLLLDEPTTNLDEAGVAIYKQLWQQYTHNRLVVVSSNDPQEYENCTAVISISDYK
ncbi:ATP-binding cassette domain-containing protein [Ferruginibacter yonginensis]|uniref:ATP-binding cassette domain-containing protein n=1 Tax=Ferruginibacter yonginensis TaxID=1310416 RepID=A0ABV8QQN8_9BACT